MIAWVSPSSVSVPPSPTADLWAYEETSGTVVVEGHADEDVWAYDRAVFADNPFERARQADEDVWAYDQEVRDYEATVFAAPDPYFPNVWPQPADVRPLRAIARRPPLRLDGRRRRGTSRARRRSSVRGRPQRARAPGPDLDPDPTSPPRGGRRGVEAVA
jgi:hypothetical protein